MTRDEQIVVTLSQLSHQIAHLQGQVDLLEQRLEKLTIYIAHALPQQVGKGGRPRAVRVRVER